MSTKTGTLCRVRHSLVMHERYARYGALAAAAIVLATLFIFRHQIRDLGELGLLGVFLANFAGSASLVIPLPSMATIFTGGYIWNPLLVGIAGGLGMTLGELTGYAVGYGGRTLFSGRRFMHVLEGWMRRAGGPIIFAASLVPNPLFDVVGIIAGSQRFPVHLFLLWTLPGKTIRSIGLAYLGALGLPQILRFLGLG